MGRLSKKDIEELREFCSLGCDYSGTKEIVSDIVSETLKEIGGTDLRFADEIALSDGNDFATLDDFVRVFWEKAVEKILNVVETQGK